MKNKNITFSVFERRICVNVEVTPLSVEDKLSKIKALVDQNNFDEAKKLIKQLEAIVGETNNELLRINNIIDFKNCFNEKDR